MDRQTDKQTNRQTDRQTDLGVELTSPFGRGQLKIRKQNCYKHIKIKMQNGTERIGRFEFVNKTRKFFNHISVRMKDLKKVENVDLENDREAEKVCLWIS